MKGLIKSAILIFNQKGLTNPSSKFNSERAYQIRRRWYLPVRGWKIRRKKTSLKNGYKGRGQTQNTSPKWGRFFCRKGLTNPSSKFNSERAYQIRRRWYLPVRGWKIRRKKTSLKNGYKGRGQTQNTSPKWGQFFCQKGLTNPSSKFNSERAYQIRRRWYLGVRGWQICQFTFKTL